MALNFISQVQTDLPSSDTGDDDDKGEGDHGKRHENSHFQQVIRERRLVLAVDGRPWLRTERISHGRLRSLCALHQNFVRTSKILQQRFEEYAVTFTFLQRKKFGISDFVWQDPPYQRALRRDVQRMRRSLIMGAAPWFFQGLSLE